MDVFLADCGHEGCGAHRVSVDVVNETRHPHMNDIRFWLGFCPHCFRPITAELYYPTMDISAVLSGAKTAGEFRAMNAEITAQNFINFWPPQPSPNAPEHLPDEIKETFVQAETNRNQLGMEGPAATSYRRAIELAVKHTTGKDVSNLKTAIDSLAKEQKITKELAEWAHEVRVIGNDGAHHKVTKADVEDARTLSQQILTYLFTLPHKLDIRAANKMIFDDPD